MFFMPAHHDALHTGHWRFLLATARELEVATESCNLRMLLFEPTNHDGCDVSCLARENNDDIDDRRAGRVLVGLPDVMWPSSTKEFCELLPQIRAIHRLEEAWAEKNRSNLITFNRLG